MAGLVEEEKEAQYYFQDDLGSPIRLADAEGNLTDSYGYDEFGQDLYGNQAVIQPFGYTGYQHDKVAGSYYAQAREYSPVQGRFAAADMVSGIMEMPFTMNRYSYCFNSPMVLADYDGAWPQWVENAGSAVEGAVNYVERKVSDVARWGYDEIWSKHIYGEDIILDKRGIGEGEYKVTSHRGGNIIVVEKDQWGNFTGWSINASVSVNLTNDIAVERSMSISGKGWNPKTWRYDEGWKYTNMDIGISYKGGLYMDSEGIGLNSTLGGNSGNLSLPLPDGTSIEDYADLSWNLSVDIQMIKWEEALEAVTVVCSAAVIALLLADDLTVVGALDNVLIAPILGYIASVAPNISQWFINVAPKLAECGG